MRKPLIAGVLLFVSLACRTAAAEPLVAHEWGTFTALQEDDGTAVGAINADDEPVPGFVCRAGNVGIAPARSPLTPALLGGKGISPCHPGVTMRLETPVIYFYPPESGQVTPINVRVEFRGGWLTEFYPPATVEAPELSDSHASFPPLTTGTKGKLFWKDVELGAQGDLTPTSDPVWTTPREVPRAATVKTVSPPKDGSFSANRPEKFLFYRGIGHLDSPLRVVFDQKTNRLNLWPNLSAMHLPAPDAPQPDLRIPAAWLIEIRPEDGFCAFRPVSDPLDLLAPAAQPTVSVSADFASSEFHADRLQELRASMQAALADAGLFPDEAVAMLKTWELSYFKSPGRRLFYLTPRAWTDRVLPLSIDGAAITRVMVGRIELITSAQRANLARIAAGPCPDMRKFTEDYYHGLESSYKAWQAQGHTDKHESWQTPTFAEMGLAVPSIYQDYLNLGRFRDALLLHENDRRHTYALGAFITDNNLRSSVPLSVTLSSFLTGNEHTP